MPKPVRNVIIGGVLLHLALGTLYSWGCVQPYVTSYISRLHDPTVTIQDTSIVFAFAGLGHSLTSPFVGLLQDKKRLGLRGTAVVGASLVALATLASSMATSVFELASLNAVLGVGVAFAYTCPLVSGYALMPDRKGTVSGFVVAGFGAGAAVFDAVATAVVNPSNTPPDPAAGYYGEEVAGRVPLMYMILGSCYLTLGLFGSWMIANPPDDDARGSSQRYTRASCDAVRSSANSDTLCGSNSNTSGIAYRGRTPHRRDCSEENNGACELRNVVVGAQPRLASPSSSPFLAMEPGDQEGQVQGQEQEGDRRKHFNLMLPPKSVSACSSAATAAVDPLSPIKNATLARGGGSGYASIQQEQERQYEPSDLEAKKVATNKNTAAAGAAAAGERQVEVWELLRENDFYHLAATMLCTAVSGLYIAGNYKGIARDIFPNADRFLSILGSVASLFNASGRVIGGLSVDRFGCFATLLVQAGFATCLLLILCLVQANRPSFFVAICLMHSLYGSNFAIYPTLAADLFGATTAGPNYGLVFMVFGVGSFLFMLWLATEAKTSGQIFLMCACISLSGTANVALLWSRQRRRGKLATGYISSVP
ncbi:unnamed protein product [Ectocarpus sp. 4 AP-2014]